MKLKLETQEQATVLVVTEAVDPTHLPILKAGLHKLIESGKKQILLDFTQVTEKDFADPKLFHEIAELRGWAQGQDAQLAVVSAIQSLGHAPTRAEALQLMSSPLGQLQAKESHLQSELKNLEQEKAALLQKLGSAGGDELKKIQAENSRLKKSIAESEKLSKKFLKLRPKDPIQVPAAQASMEALAKLVDSFIEGAGAAK